MHTTMSKYLPFPSAFLNTPSTCTDNPTNERVVRMAFEVAHFDEGPRYVPFVNNVVVSADANQFFVGVWFDVGVSVGS